MYKSLWARVLACLAVVVVLSLSVTPLMVGAESTLSELPSELSIDPALSGDAWGKESTNFSQFYQFSLNSFSYSVIADLTNGINSAYKGGMFGGSIPIAIVATKQQGITFLDIITLSQSAMPSQNSMGSKVDALSTTTCTIQEVDSSFATIQIAGDRTTYPGTKIVPFRVCINGDFAPLTVSNQFVNIFAEDFDAISSAMKILAIRTGYFANEYSNNQANTPLDEVSTLSKISGDWYISESSSADKTQASHWFAPATNSPASPAMEQWASSLEFAYTSNATVYSEGYNTGYADGVRLGNQTAYNTGYNAGYAEGEADGYTEGHAEGYTDGFLDGSPQEIDIVSIFDSMFNASRDILDVFAIELFGINIAGTLVAILVIAIVAFVVGKLWK